MRSHAQCEKCGKYEPATMNNPHYPELPDGWREILLHDYKVNQGLDSRFRASLCRVCWPDVWAGVESQMKFKVKP